MILSDSFSRVSNPYETPQLVSDYLFFHYAAFHEAAGDLPIPESAWGFAQRVVNELLDPTPLPPLHWISDARSGLPLSSWLEPSRGSWVSTTPRPSLKPQKR